jgi:predicted RNase H-like HicB family nuclease
VLGKGLAQMKKATAIYERDETGTWVVTVPEYPGCITQGRSIHEARLHVREALEALIGVRSAKAVEWVDNIQLPNEVLRLVRENKRARAKARQAEAIVSESTRKVTSKLKKLGLSVRDSGALLDLSHNAVQKILKAS